MVDLVGHEAPANLGTRIYVRRPCSQTMPKAGFTPDIKIEVTSPLAALNMVEAGLSFAITGEPKAYQYPKCNISKHANGL